MLNSRLICQAVKAPSLIFGPCLTRPTPGCFADVIAAPTSTSLLNLYPSLALSLTRRRLLLALTPEANGDGPAYFIQGLTFGFTGGTCCPACSSLTSETRGLTFGDSEYRRRYWRPSASSLGRSRSLYQCLRAKLGPSLEFSPTIPKRGGKRGRNGKTS